MRKAPAIAGAWLGLGTFASVGRLGALMPPFEVVSMTPSTYGPHTNVTLTLRLFSIYFVIFQRRAAVRLGVLAAVSERQTHTDVRSEERQAVRVGRHFARAGAGQPAPGSGRDSGP